MVATDDDDGDGDGDDNSRTEAIQNTWQKPNDNNNR